MQEVASNTNIYISSITIHDVYTKKLVICNEVKGLPQLTGTKLDSAYKPLENYITAPLVNDNFKEPRILL